MGKETKKPPEEILSAIMAFEQILDAMPDDRTSLETLWHAYEQLGDHAKSAEYLVRLGKAVIADGDAEAAAALVEKAKPSADAFPDVAAIVAKLEALVPKGAAPAGGKGRVEDTKETLPPIDDSSIRRTFNVQEELSLAWALLEANELTQEEYASVVQDLTEMSAGDSGATVSVLHVLEARTFKGLDRIVSYIAQSCSTPVVALSNFDIQLDVGTMMPMDFVVGRGALVYELIGKEGLAVVMNPYDKQLRKDVEALARRKCHFFVCLPSEFDRAVRKVLEAKADQEAAAAKGG